jgi:hypothetical protein
VSAATARDLAAFAAGVAIAWIMGWSTRDVVWGFWLASWITGTAAIGLPWLRVTLAAREPGAQLVGAVIGGASVLWHAFFLGFFHVIWGFIVDGAVPIFGAEGRVYTGPLTWRGGAQFAVVPAIAECVRLYWPFLLVVLARELPRRWRHAPGVTEENLWALLIRFHALVMLSIVLHLVGAESFAGYVIVLLILFSPAALWKKLFGRTRAPDTRSP